MGRVEGAGAGCGAVAGAMEAQGTRHGGGLAAKLPHRALALGLEPRCPPARPIFWALVLGHQAFSMAFLTVEDLFT